jgi:iron complex outermembrane receptor protein
LSYTKGEYADGEVGPCNEFDDNGAPVIPDGQPVVLCDISGDPIGRAPDWSASLNTEYRIPVGSNEAYVRGLYSYTGEQYAGDLGYLDTYNTFDAFVGIRGESWNVELFARNLFDEEAIITGSPATALVRSEPTGYGPLFPIPSRRVGISASYRW